MSAAVVTPFSALEEMIILLAGMTKTVSRYRLLSVHLGTTVDCRLLREEMTALRNKMLEEVRHSRENFVTSCKEKEIGPEQDEADRLFCVYLAGIELFTQELLRTFDLYKVFTGPDLLLATGMQDYIHMRSGVRFGVRGRKGSNSGLEGNTQAFPDEVEDMFMAIDEIKEALADLQASVSIAPWTMTADTDQVVPNKFGSHSSLVSSEAEEPSKTVSVTHSAVTSASHTRETLSRATSGANHEPSHEHEIIPSCCSRTRKAKVWMAGVLMVVLMSAIVLIIIICISVVTPRTDTNGTVYETSLPSFFAP